MTTAKLDDLLTDKIDYRIYISVLQARELRPPYSPNAVITPHSVYGDNEWIEPLELLAHGSQDHDRISFTGWSSVPGNIRFAFSGEHAKLVEQLKEACYAFKFYRSFLVSRRKSAGPRTFLSDARGLKLLFANFAAAGVKSLDQLTPAIAKRIFGKLPVTERSHDGLVRYFQDVIILSRAGLIQNGVLRDDFRIELKNLIIDTSEKRGATTLPEWVISHILCKSRFYIDNAEKIITYLSEAKRWGFRNSQIKTWMNKNLPLERDVYPMKLDGTIEWLIRAAGYNLLGFQFGSRISEIFSSNDQMLRRLVDSTTGEATYEATLTIFKGGRKGRKRKYTVHPYVARIAHVLNMLNTALGNKPNTLFFRKKKQSHKTISVNLMNSKLQRFAELHGCDFDITSHSWRYGLSDVVLGVLENPFPILQQRLGHKFVAEAIRYGMHGPGGDELKEAAGRAAASATERFLRMLLEEDELGGHQGRTISEAIRSGASIDDVGEDLDSLGVVPVLISEDEYCLKHSAERGECSYLTGDKLPEPEGCQAGCEFHLQTTGRLHHWERFISKLDEFCMSGSVSLMEKIRQTELLKQNLGAWPSLRPILRAKLAANPGLETWFT